MLKTQCLPCVLMLIFGCCGIECSAESVVVAATFRNDRGTITESTGTAFVVHSNERGSILLTCKHVIEDAGESVWIAHNGKWVKCGHVMLHPTEDVAAFECSVQLKSVPLIEEIPAGSQVIVDGAGPTLHKTDEEWFFRGQVVSDDEIEGDGGVAVIQGDSGGPVLAKTADRKYAACGIVHAYPRTSPEGLTRRDQHCRFKTVSLYIPAKKFTPWLTAQYCPSGQCPIQIRPQVVQPFGPLGFPRGPARVIGIAEPVPQQYVPVQPDVRHVPDPISSVGIPGPRGLQGPPGRDGEPGRSVQQIEVEATVNAWLDSNIDRIRGPQGPPGEPGRDGSSADVSGLESRLTTIEKRKFRMVISSDGKIIDDESFEPGEPVVLDLKRLRSVSGGK
jgi:hypothetical protein